MLIVAAACILLGIGLVSWELVTDYMGEAQPPTAAAGTR